MSDNAFQLKWNNHLQNMYAQLENLYSHQNLVDVSISCTDGILKAHRVVLSACSPYFESIFKDNSCKHPVLILKGVSSREMQALLKFMYKGFVEVLDVDLQSFMCTANELKIRGLADELLKDTIKVGSEKDDESSDEENRRKDCDTNSPESGEVTNIDGVKITNIRTENFQDADRKEEYEEDTNKIQSVKAVERNGDLSSETKMDLSHSMQSLTSINEDLSNVVDLTKHSATRSEELNSKKDTASTETTITEATTIVPSETNPFARETRFKGRKRVSVDFTSRNRSTERKENEVKFNENCFKKIQGLLKDDTQSNKRSAFLMENGKQSESENPVKSFKRETSEHSSSPDNVGIKEEVNDMDMFCISSMVEKNDGQEIAEDADEDLGENAATEEPSTDDWNSDTVCTFCYLNCHNSSDLKKHIRIHTGEKPHECDLCELAFARASHLARHRRVHTGERPFTCTSCGRSFSRQDKLKQHARRHHAAEPAKIQNYQLDKPRRPRGRPPKILSMVRNPSVERRPTGLSDFSPATPESSSTSLPFGDTSYLSSLSLGQQRYNDLTISPIIDPGPSGSRSSTQKVAEDLLQSVRQLGECTIQAFPGQVPPRTRVE